MGFYGLFITVILWLHLQVSLDLNLLDFLIVFLRLLVYATISIVLLPF